VILHRIMSFGRVVDTHHSPPGERPDDQFDEVKEWRQTSGTRIRHFTNEQHSKRNRHRDPLWLGAPSRLDLNPTAAATEEHGARRGG